MYGVMTSFSCRAPVFSALNPAYLPAVLPAAASRGSAARLLFDFQILVHLRQIVVEPRCIRLASRANLLDDFIFRIHSSAPINSSGVQTTGNSNPRLLITRRAARWISEFAICRQFQVSITRSFTRDRPFRHQTLR